jgi:hypothetical protein
MLIILLSCIKWLDHSASYLGTIVNGNNTVEEEIRERNAKGNKAFYANRTF